MNEQIRIVVVGRQQEALDPIVRLLESVGCIVTGTLNDSVAIDLAGSSDYDALLIGDDVSRPDQRYVATAARSKSPSMQVLMVRGLESVLTQLRQAGITV